MRIRILLGTLLLVGMVHFTHAQYRAPRASSGGGGLSDRIYFGGGGGFSGGSQYLNISVTPLVGYKFTEDFSGGMQLVYQYVKAGDFSISNYGGGPFLRYNLTDNLFGYTQYEYLNFGYIVPGSVEKERLGFNSWFVGLGYSMPIGNNVAFNITALYNLMYNDGRSPYASPLVFRVGIVAGLF